METAWVAARLPLPPTKMFGDSTDSRTHSSVELLRRRARRMRVRYAVLTLALFVPLLCAFLSIRNLYPFAASTMMMAGGDLRSGTEYFILRGETASGETIDLPPAELTDALTGRHWSLVGATVENKSFVIASPHPSNALLVAEAGGAGMLPRAARLKELLRAWGEIYNARRPETSARRLRAVRLDAYRWEGKTYGDYERFVESWRAEL
ncbi:MAG: hypothetical protein QOC99_2904 [Acidobacteriota bacterium]|nr:hypothetical protein [Acidobacteriota bacterium]